VLDKAKSVDPNDPLIHLALADNLSREKNNDASFKELQAAFALPDLNIDQKVRIVVGYFPKFADPAARAGALTSAHSYARSSSAYTQTNLKLMLYMVMCWSQSEKYSEAKTAYEKSIALTDRSTKRASSWYASN
jgi:tetratricopeptide (TPR) repeat protein